MGEERNGLFGGLQSLVNRFPIVREQAVMQGMEWMSGAGFAWLAQARPELATWLHETVKNNTVLTRIVLSVIGEIASRVAGLEHDDINNARIADALVAIQNMVRLGNGLTGRGSEQPTAGLSILQLQKRLASLPVETAKPIIDRLAGMPVERKQRVLRLIAHFNPDQMANLLSMDEDVLEAMLTLGDTPVQLRDQPAEDPFLARLRALGQTLKAKSDGRKE